MINNPSPQQIPEDRLHLLAAVKRPRGAGAGSNRGPQHVAALAVAVPGAGPQHHGRWGGPADAAERLHHQLYHQIQQAPEEIHCELIEFLKRLTID